MENTPAAPREAGSHTTSLLAWRVTKPTTTSLSSCTNIHAPYFHATQLPFKGEGGRAKVYSVKQENNKISQVKSAGTLTYLTDPSGKLVWVKYNPKGLYIPWNSTCPKFYWYSKLQSYPKEVWNTNKYESKPNLGNSHLLNPLLLKATVFQPLLPYCSQEILEKEKHHNLIEKINL